MLVVQDCGDITADYGVDTKGNDEGKGFQVPKFAPAFASFVFDSEQKRVVIDETCYLKGTSGKPLNGMSTSAADDTPFDGNCQSGLSTGPNGFDPEDIHQIPRSNLCLGAALLHACIASD